MWRIKTIVAAPLLLALAIPAFAADKDKVPRD